MASLRELRVKKGMELSSGALRAMFDGEALARLTQLDLTACTMLEDEGVRAFTKWWVTMEICVVIARS